MVRLAVSLMLMSQQCILNKVSLNRNTHKTKLCVHWFIDENVVIRGSQEPNPVLPLEEMVQYIG